MRQLKEGLLDKRNIGNIRNIKNDDKIWIVANFDDSMDLEKSSKLHFLRTNDYVDLYIGYKRDFMEYSKDLEDMSVSFYEVYDKIDMKDVLKRLNGISWFNKNGVLRRSMESKKLCMKMEFEDLFEGLLNKTNIHNIGDDETWFLCLSTCENPIFNSEYEISTPTYTYWLYDKETFIRGIYNTYLRRSYSGYLFVYRGNIKKDELVKSVQESGFGFRSKIDKTLGYFTRIKMEDVKKWV